MRGEGGEVCLQGNERGDGVIYPAARVAMMRVESENFILDVVWTGFERV